MSSKTWTVASPLLYGIGLVICLLALLMLLAAPPPADAQGGGTITGTVFDDGGSTVAGADVWAEPYWGGMGYGTQSDLNGVYTFTGLISDVYRVGAYKFGYATEYFSDTVDYEAAQPIFVSGGTTAGIDFYLGPGGDLTGTVALVGNLSPITSAFVDASPADPNLWWGSGGQVSGSGVYTLTGLPPGDYVVSARAPGYAPEFFDNKPPGPAADLVGITAGVVNGPVDFTLEAGGTITGTVTDVATTLPISGMHVFAELYDTGWWIKGMETDASGVYTLTELPAGDYRLGVCGYCVGQNYVNVFFPNNLNPQLAARVPVNFGQTVGGIDFALAAGGIITGSVVDAVTTLPITDTWVDATMDSPLGYSSNAPVNNNGDYMIIGLPTGGYKVGANAPGYLPEFYKDHFFWQFADVVSVTAGAVTPNITFTLELPPPGGISGIVADAAGSPLPFADVWVEPYFGGPGRIDVQADDTGLYAITGLFSGTYRVGAGKPGYTSELYNNVVDWNAATPVTVTNFMVTGIDFFLDQGATITGTVVDAGTGLPIFDAWVSADRAYGAPFGAGASTDPQGFYAITGLPPGEYKLNANHALYIEEFFDNQPIWDTADIISVTNGTVVSNVNFSLDIGGMITGTVMNEAGTAPIKDAWVHADRISGIPFDRGAPTGPNGRYAITGLPDGNYIVGAVADRFDPEFYLNQTDWSLADPVPVTAGAPTGNITFTLKAEEGGQIYGRVVKPSGTGVPYAWIDAKTDDGLHDKGVEADQFGRFRLGGLVTGTWWLVAHPPGDPAFNKFSESIPRPVPVQFTSVITLSPPLTLTRINLVGRAMLPDGNPAMDAWAEVHTPNYSIHRGHGTTPQGYFGTSVPAGNYALEIYPPWDAPNLMKIGPVPVTVTNPSTVTYVGVFTFSRFTKHIEGRVVRGAGGTMVVPKTSTAPGVPNVDVNAWKRGTDKWAWDRTDVDGNFKMDVSPGEWEVMISAAPDTPADWIYPGRPKLVEFAPTITEETRVITFSVEPAGAKVTGQLVEPDGTPVIPWRAWIDVRRPDGVGNGTTVGAGGVFTVAAVEGNYHVWIGIDETAYPTFAAPVITDPIVITDFNQIVDLGVLTLTEKTAAIEGLVTRKSDGSGVGGIEVFAWQRDGGWASATTKPDGSYHIPVVPGQWEVDVAVPPDAKFVNLQPPARLSLKDGETKFADFELMEATGTIKGLLQDPNGVFLTDVDGWGYIRLGNSPEPIVDGPIENGQFTFNVPPGTYKVGVWLPPNSGYTVAGEADVTVLRGQTVSLIAQAKTPAEVAMLDLSTTEQRAAVQAGTTYTLTFTLLPNDAFIRGTFYLDTNKTQPAIGLEGMVFAWGGFGSGTWQAVPIDPDTAGYEIAVAAGTWNVGYWLESPNYINSPPPETRLTLASGQAFNDINFSVVQANVKINGRILKPDGSPFNYAWAWAHRDRIPGVSAAIDTGDESKPPDGRFSISVTSGGTYVVGAHAPEHLGYIQPDAVIVPVTATTGTGSFNLPVDLQFKESNGNITGTVYYHNEAGQRVIGPGAWVWAWSEAGQHTGAAVQADGTYRLNIVTGTTWWVGAAYQIEGGSIYYETRWPPTRVPMTTTTQATVDLDLVRGGTALPPAIGGTFQANVGWTGILSDGTIINIPPGAMPTTNPTDTVRISVTPLVEELPNTLSSRPFGFGYAIAAYEEATGNQIVSNFNANVLLIFHYTQQQLQERGITEDDLSPSYLSTTTNSWTKVESFVVYTDTQRITAYINHFSAWALSAWALSSEISTHQVYLPLIIKN